MSENIEDNIETTLFMVPSFDLAVNTTNNTSSLSNTDEEENSNDNLNNNNNPVLNFNNSFNNENNNNTNTNTNSNLLTQSSLSSNFNMDSINFDEINEILLRNTVSESNSEFSSRVELNSQRIDNSSNQRHQASTNNVIDEVVIDQDKDGLIDLTKDNDDILIISEPVQSNNSNVNNNNSNNNSNSSRHRKHLNSSSQSNKVRNTARKHTFSITSFRSTAPTNQQQSASMFSYVNNMFK